MRVRIGIVAAFLLAGAGTGAAAWAQSPAEKAEQVARLKARLEADELAHEVDRDVLKESIALLKRAERDLAIDRARSEGDEAHHVQRIKSLRQYVEAERHHFEQHGAALEMSRRELRTAQAPQPIRPAQPATRPGAPGENRDDLERRADEAQVGVNLLQAELTLAENTLNQQVSTLAALEVRAADPATQASEPLTKELEQAKTRYADLRRRYLDLKAKHNKEQRSLLELQQRAGINHGGFR